MIKIAYLFIVVVTVVCILMAAVRERSIVSALKTGVFTALPLTLGGLLRSPGAGVGEEPKHPRPRSGGGKQDHP